MKEKTGNILITAVGGDIGQSVIDCLKETEYSDGLFGCDIDQYAAGKSSIKDFSVAPAVKDTVGYMQYVNELIRKWDIKFVLPLNEQEITFFANNSKDFSAQIVALDKRTIDVCLDKYETANFLKMNGVNTPRTFLAQEYNEDLPFPFVMKSRKGCGAKGLFAINDDLDLEYYLRKYPDSVIQENVGSNEEEYTMAVFSDGARISSFAFRRKLGYGSMTRIAFLFQNAELESLGIKIADLFGLKGSMNIQVRKTAQGFLPFEINPRISSTCYFRHKFGFQDVKWWLDILNGRDFEYVPKYSQGVAVRTVGSLFFEMKGAK